VITSANVSRVGLDLDAVAIN